MTDLTKYSGAGMDTAESISSTMPFIQMIQSGSPEIKKSHKHYEVRKVPGAEEGDIVFLPEKILFKGNEGLRAIPVGFRSLYTEWRPSNSGGGFIGTQPLGVVSNPQYRKDGYNEFLGENELKATIYVANLFEAEGSWKKGLIAFTSTQLKKARNWSKIITSFRYPDNKELAPPIFACAYRIKTRSESNDSGNWFGWSIENEGPIEEEALLDQAMEAYREAMVQLPSATEARRIAPSVIEEGEEAF